VATLATLAVSAKGVALRLVGAESGAAYTVVRVAEIGGAAVVLLFGLLMLGGALAAR
jgi:ABC-type nickel/cobalt efflux system permease component RcnA